MRMRSRSLRADDRAEDIMPMLIFIGLFITVAAMLIAGGYALWSENDANAGRWEEMSAYEIIGNATYVMRVPADGYQVTMANASDYISVATYVPHGGDEYRFGESDPAEDDAVKVGFVRDNDHYGWGGIIGSHYQDFFWARCAYGWLSYGYEAIDFNEVVNHQVGGANYSTVGFSFGNRGYTLIVTTPGTPESFETYLDLNVFSIRVGVSLEDLAPSGSMWAVLGQLVSADLPNVHPIINLLITVAIWAAIAVIIIEVWMRLWPL
jgi:hypothetical protein